MTQGKADPQAGEKLFNALRELEVQFLNGGHSVQTSAQKLLKDHGYSPANQMAKYLIAQSILKKDEQNSTHKKPMYWYNGEKLSVKYCNSLILQMKLDRSASKKTPPCRPEENPFPIDKDPYGRDRVLPPGYVDPWDADEKEKIKDTPELKAGKKAYQEKMREIEHINQARIREQDMEINDLKETLEMRLVEIKALNETVKYSERLSQESKKDFERSIEIQVELSTKLRDQKKKYKKLKKLIKAVL